MVSLIIGHKGTGKTKHLIDEVNKAMEASNGNVICIEKGSKLTYDINSRVRLVSADDFAISGYEAYYGFLAGMCAGDSDITDILADGTLKIGGEPGPEQSIPDKSSRALRDLGTQRIPGLHLHFPQTRKIFRRKFSSLVKRSETSDTQYRRKDCLSA